MLGKVKGLVPAAALLLVVAAFLTVKRPAAARFDPKMSRVCEKGCALKMAYRESDLAPQPDVPVGALTRCPVSGVVFRAEFEGPRRDLMGREYRFCCATCARLFEKAPRRFVSAGPRPTAGSIVVAGLQEVDAIAAH